MGQTTVADIFAHTDGHFFCRRICRSLMQPVFTNHNLTRETDVVVDILFAKADGFFTADFQWFCLNMLSSHGG